MFCECFDRGGENRCVVLVIRLLSSSVLVAIRVGVVLHVVVVGLVIVFAVVAFR